MKKINMGKFVLLIGKDATEIFDYYSVDKMHGLNRKDAQAEEVDQTVGNGVYIYGWTNYDPRDKKLTAKPPYKPFLFLNKKHFKGTYEDITLVFPAGAPGGSSQVCQIWLNSPVAVIQQAFPVNSSPSAGNGNAR